jgi:hypothetical protein
MNLLYNSEVIASSAANICTKTTIFGPAVDMRDAEGCLFILSGDTEGLSYGTSGTFHLQCSTYSSGGWANYGSTVVIRSTETAGNKKVWVLDAYKPTFAYLRGAWYHCTGNASLVCLKYNVRKGGSTHLRDTAGIKTAANISSS